ncbi:MAG: hypothetical protein AAF998_02140 [Bacteroidota bacterium]
MITLHRVICDLIQEDKNPTSEDIWNKIQEVSGKIPPAPLPQGQDDPIRKMTSKLHKIIENYLTIEHFIPPYSESTPQRWLLTMEALKNYDHRKSFDFLDRRLEKELRRLPTSPEKEILHHYHEVLRADYYRFGSARDKYPVPFTQILTSLDRFFLLSRLKFTVLGMNQRLITGKASEIPLDNYWPDFIVKYESEFQDSSYFQIYSGIYRLQEANNGAERLNSLRELAHLFLQGYLDLPRADQSICYILILNLLTRNYNRQEDLAPPDQLAKEVFTWYTLGLKESFLLRENGQIDHALIKNVVELGLRAGEIDEVESVLHAYLDRIESKDFPVENAIEFFELNILVHKREWESAHQMVRRKLQERFRDIYYEMGTKMLSLKILYECRERDDYLRLLKSLGELIRQNKVLHPSQKELYRERLKWFRKLGNAQLDDEWTRLSRAITQSPSFVDKEWIIEKIKTKGK